MNDETPTDALARLNSASATAFVQRLGGVFEHSPWVAERVEAQRPFASLDALHAAMVRAVEASDREQQLALLREHPELAGKAARTGEMTADSVSEQSSAGLDALTRAEMDRMAHLNAAYRGKFGFPFIIAVRTHTKHAIFDEMARRLANDAATEISNDLEQVYAITRMRLTRLLGQRRSPMASLTTHVLDIHAGMPAEGMRIDFSRLDGDAYRLVKSVATDADGRAPEALLDAAAMRTGRYELVFHVADYFAGRGVALADPPFVERVPVRFSIAKPDEHYHVPLLVSPWSYSTYRGS